MTEPRTAAGRALLATENVGDGTGWVEHSYADTRKAILAIEAEARAAALDEARAAVEATGSEYIPDLLAAIDALREGADKSS